MVISYTTLLLIVNPHAIDLDIGITIKPTPVSDYVIELDVVAIIIILSCDFIIVDSVLYFLDLFFAL